MCSQIFFTIKGPLKPSENIMNIHFHGGTIEQFWVKDASFYLIFLCIFWQFFEFFFAQNLKLIVLCSYYFTFRLWENWYELWVKTFSQVHKGDKNWLREANFEISSACRAQEISKASRSQFFLPREPEKTFHEHFISVWAHPKGKIFRTDCFISFFGVFVCNSSKIKIYFATIMNQVMNAPSFQEFPWK